ncbi:helix-turn-helix domain-containing protein [Streptomyces profundus]|uniref:helix-turn-helix domain-containing protein n=1 Tax=Streptomyces profundus TaxID=2867410 RepID=UPI001D162822|nr:helix-turn-helix domain-containing protein [Streptomyces sp. MA3_2.13]
MQSYIREHLGDSELTPRSVARAHHISLRYLHRLFHQHGLTVAAWIRQQRLEGCWRDLTDAAMFAHPIQAIAGRWGFTDSAHFSRAFRAAYGLPPSHLRRRAKTVWEERVVGRGPGTVLPGH